MKMVKGYPRIIVLNLPALWRSVENADGQKLNTECKTSLECKRIR